MGVIGTAAIKHTGRSADDNVASGAEYTTIYLVYSDSSDDDSIVIEQASGIPAFGSHYQAAHSYNLNAILRRRSSREIGATPDGRHIWEVTCVFSTNLGNPDKADTSKDPIEFPLEIEIDGEEFLDHPEADLLGNKFQTAAGEPYDASHTGVPKNYAIITFIKYQINDPLLTALAYQNTVNSDYFYGAEPGTLKCAKIGGRLEYKNGYARFKASYVFHYRTPDVVGPNGTIDPTYTWKRVLLNAGEYYLDLTGKKVFENIEGQRKHSPTKLDLNGNKLADGATPTYLAFKTFNTANFFNLNL